MRSTRTAPVLRDLRGAAGLFHFAAPFPALLAAGLGVGVAVGGWSGVLRALGRGHVRLRSDP